MSLPNGAGEREPSVGSIRTGRGMDIPGSSVSHTYLFESASTPGDVGDSPTADINFSPHMSLSYGTSPGHGLGYLMRSRRRPQQLAHQVSRELSGTLHSYDEEAVFDAEGGDDAAEKGAGVMSPLTDDPSMAFSPHDELSVPLLRRLMAKRNDNDPAVSVEGPQSSSSVVKGVVFGVINATAGIPALVAFAAIVFRDPLYSPYVDLMCKFFFLSSALHQAIFCMVSSLPFAVGQVQDVGIIFLSAMASSVAMLTLEAGYGAATALGTSLLTMTLSTFFVGVGTMIVAKMSWAEFVQFIPLPVMGGYLAYVGYFCIASGAGLGVSVEIGSITSWIGLFHRLPLLKFIPTVLSCAAMMLTLEHARSPLALPSVLIGLVALFHVVLMLSGVSLAQAQATGWVLPPAAENVQFWKLWSLYHFKDWKMSGIYFPAIWRQAGKALGLLMVVIFGSCMDIAAIQQDLPYKLDFNRELTTVAFSNMATGLCGVGYTGSYIFSQTIFSMRAGVQSRVNGWIIVAAEVLVFAVPFSVTNYLPNFFLGALLLWFGVEIARDWLFLSAFKLTKVEYALLWMTFGSIMQWGLEGGIAAGIVFATLFFAYAYARSQVNTFKAGRERSSVVRTVEHRAALDLLWDSHVATAQLQGFVFFGSAHHIGAKLNEAAARLGGQGHSEGQEQQRLEEAIQHSIQSTGEDYAGHKQEQALAALAVAPKFMVVDFSKVSGMDSSGARTVADSMREMEALGVTPVITGTQGDGIANLLNVNDVRLRAMRWPPELQPPPPPVPSAASLDAQADEWPPAMGDDAQFEVLPPTDDLEPEAFSFPTLEEGLRYCEDAMLEVAVQFGLCTPPGAGTSLKDLLVSHLEKMPLTAPSNADAMAATLRRYLGRRSVRRGEALWQPGDPANELFLVERGVVRVDQFVTHREGEYGQQDGSTQRVRSVRVRSYELGPGCVAGSTDFYLARPHGTRAVCASVACRVLRLSRTAMARMAVEAPAALNVLQMAVMRANTSDLSAAAEWPVAVM